MLCISKKHKYIRDLHSYLQFSKLHFGNLSFNLLGSYVKGCHNASLESANLSGNLLYILSRATSLRAPSFGGLRTLIGGGLTISEIYAVASPAIVDIHVNMLLSWVASGVSGGIMTGCSLHFTQAIMPLPLLL